MKKIFKEAHKMTREMVKKYKVDYQAQFGLCLSYLLKNKKEENEVKELKPATLKLGNRKYEVELRRDPEELAEKLNINLDVAAKLSAMEVLGDTYMGQNKTTFKNWKNKRIYFTNSMDSNNQNSKQRYWDLENAILVDNGLSNLERREMAETLYSITTNTFYN